MSFAGVFALMAALPPLTGVWSGDRTVLTLTATGGWIEQECASGSFSGPIRPDAKGRFNARGGFSPAAGSGPQPEVSVQRPATFAGRFDGKSILLTIDAANAAPVRVSLSPGRKVKLIRCL